MRDACKAKYLLASDKLTDEQKAEYSAVVENLQKPAKTTYAQAAVPLNEEQRMLAHSETARALEATNALARQIADEEIPADPDQPGTDEPGTEDPGTENPGDVTDQPGTGSGSGGAGSSTPKTGDSSSAVPALAVMALAVSAAVLAGKKRLTNKGR